MYYDLYVIRERVESAQREAAKARQNSGSASGAPAEPRRRLSTVGGILRSSRRAV